MPAIEVVYYRDDDDTVPMVVWLEGLRSQPKHRAKCVEWIGLLRDHGHDLRRPNAEYLTNGIYELRVRFQRVRYRMLYFYYGWKRAVITHGITKQTEKVPVKEIDRATTMKKVYEEDPELHSHWEIDHD